MTMIHILHLNDYKMGLPEFQNQRFHCHVFPEQLWSCAKRNAKKEKIHILGTALNVF